MNTSSQTAFALPRFDVMKLNKLVVSAYKFAGFAVLATILLGLASFMLNNLFYLVNQAWVTPLVLSSTDPRVLQLNEQYAAERAARDGVMTHRLELQARLDDARRVRASEEGFQRAFQSSMLAEASDRSAELAGMRRLLENLRATREDVSATSKEYTAISREGLKQEMAARLIDEDQATRGAYELSQIAGVNLALHEKNVELEARIAELSRAVTTLHRGPGKSGEAKSYQVLHMMHELEQSVLASQRATGDEAALGASLEMLDRTIASYDAQLERIEKAPYLLAADKNVSTAFVPYDNADGLKPGDAVFTCKLGVFGCHRAGRVAELLDGEVLSKHPLHGRELRGILVRLEVEDASAMRRPVLHLRHAPVGF